VQPLLRASGHDALVGAAGAGATSAGKSSHSAPPGPRRTARSSQVRLNDAVTGVARHRRRTGYSAIYLLISHRVIDSSGHARLTRAMTSQYRQGRRDGGDRDDI